MIYASPSWAWGDLGHKIICQIAFEELNDKARNEVTRLIALDATFNSFPDACTWPDHPRKRAEEHFINLGRSSTRSLSPSALRCRSASSPRFRPTWSGPCVNGLHTVWDTCIIEKKLGTDPQTIAQDLLDGLPDSDRAAWVTVPIAGWANESFQVTRRKSVQYCVRVGAKCFYQEGNEGFSEGRRREGGGGQRGVSRAARAFRAGSAEAGRYSVSARPEFDARTVGGPEEGAVGRTGLFPADPRGTSSW